MRHEIPTHLNVEDSVLLGLSARQLGTLMACAALAYHEIGIGLPRVAQAQYEATARVSKGELQPGDLVFFWATDGVPWVSHVGIYLGQGQMVDAPTTGAVVRVEPIFTGYWGAHYYGAGRVRA